MKITDVFIKRPVLSSVISFLILLLGIGGIFGLPLRQYPKMHNTVISVVTAFPGADAATMKSFITEPIQQAIATTEGINYIDSTSGEGSSTINIVMRLNADANAALTEITGKVSSVRHLLPKGTESPVIRKLTGNTFPALILAMTSQEMNAQQVSAYIHRVISPELSNVSGVARVMVWGGDEYAMRIWLDPLKMAAFRITPNEVMQALQKNNVQTQAGNVRGELLQFEVTGGTQLSTVKGFQNLVVKQQGPQLVYLRDIAKVELGSRDIIGKQVLFNGKHAYFVAVELGPDTNPLLAVEDVLKRLPSMQQSLPKGLTLRTLYNATEYIASALHEVVRTLLEAILIVVLVILCCLGSFRSVLIPVVAIPLSLIGVCFFMYLLGFSFNLLTFLAMVLAIGMVVDDAIVVVENIHRHMEEGEDAMKAAMHGAKEIAVPVVIMTLTLAAVFAPIGFVSGVTGVLFREFAFTLAGAVILSGVIALTLSPMLCSKVLSVKDNHTRFAEIVNGFFHRLAIQYKCVLLHVVRMRKLSILVALCVVANIVVFYVLTPKELAPQEDQGFIGMIATGPIDATVNYTKQYNPHLQKIFSSFPSLESAFLVNGYPGVNQIFGGLVLKPWRDREQSQEMVKNKVQQMLRDLPGIEAYAFSPPPLPGVGEGMPIALVLKSTLDFKDLYQAAETLKALAYKSGLFVFLQTNLAFNTPKLGMQIDRQKAADMGVSMDEIASSLSVLIGDIGVNRFNFLGSSYEVVPHVAKPYDSDAQALGSVYIHADDGKLIPLYSLMDFKRHNQANALNQFQQLNAVTLSGIPAHGVAMGRALNYLKQTVSDHLSKLIEVDYAGESRQFIQEGNSLAFAFIFSILIIFLLLAAQYESFRDPFVVMLSVPMSLFGALLPLFFGFGTINIYTQIGLITLVGLISKHGILIVSCANDYREKGFDQAEAIVQAAGQRLRPVLMTTAAMVFGVVPLLTAVGAGAVSRFDLGLVIACGMLIGTFFTLFVVPCFYMMLSHTTQSVSQS